MRRAVGLFLCAALLVGCPAEVSNTATVYPPLSGLVEVRWRLETPGVAKVEYGVNGTLVGSSTDAEARFSVQLDTAKLGNGLHTLTVSAYDAEDRPLRIIQHTLLVRN